MTRHRIGVLPGAFNLEMLRRAGGAIERMLEDFRLLVASRQGRFSAPAHLRHRVESLPFTGDFDHVSSTEVRKRIAASLAWEHLVPEPIIKTVRRVYLETPKA